MTDVQKILENTEYALKKLKNSCVETIKDRDRMSKEMFEIYIEKRKRGRCLFCSWFKWSGHVSALFPYVPIDSTFWSLIGTPFNV